MTTVSTLFSMLSGFSEKRSRGGGAPIDTGVVAATEGSSGGPGASDIGRKTGEGSGFDVYFGDPCYIQGFLRHRSLNSDWVYQRFSQWEKERQQEGKDPAYLDEDGCR